MPPTSAPDCTIDPPCRFYKYSTSYGNLLNGIVDTDIFTAEILDDENNLLIDYDINPIPGINCKLYYASPTPASRERVEKFIKRFESNRKLFVTFKFSGLTLRLDITRK